MFFFPVTFLGQPVAFLGKVPVTAKSARYTFWRSGSRDIEKVPVTILDKVAVTFQMLTVTFFDIFLITYRTILNTSPLPINTISSLCFLGGGVVLHAIQVHWAMFPVYYGDLGI